MRARQRAPASEGATTMANELGKRYACAVCGTEVLCTKAGGGTAMCCDQPMELKQPKPLPSAD
jgi:desulfoferrodoxin-like iron-binding protein